MQEKECTRCRVCKPVDQFPWHKDHRLLAGGRVGSHCKACQSERAKAWQASNYDRALANQRRWREENKDRINQTMARATKRYMAARKHNTPSWADHDKIEAIYTLAAQMREACHDVEVDHIIPLQGRIASGLHVHWNLQIIPRRQNRRKKNTTDPKAYDIPNAWDEYCTIA